MNYKEGVGLLSFIWGYALLISNDITNNSVSLFLGFVCTLVGLLIFLRSGD